MLRLFVAISFSSSIIFCFKFSFSLIRSSDRFLSFSNRSSMHWTGFRFLNCCFSSWIALHTFSSFSGFAIASLLLIKPMHVFCVLSFRFVSDLFAPLFAKTNGAAAAAAAAAAQPLPLFQRQLRPWDNKLCLLITCAKRIM